MPKTGKSRWSTLGVYPCSSSCRALTSLVGSDFFLFGTIVGGNESELLLASSSVLPSKVPDVSVVLLITS